LIDSYSQIEFEIRFSRVLRIFIKDEFIQFEKEFLVIDKFNKIFMLLTRTHFIELFVALFEFAEVLVDHETDELIFIFEDGLKVALP
jgi:hypothetical protein